MSKFTITFGTNVKSYEVNLSRENSAMSLSKLGQTLFSLGSTGTVKIRDEGTFKDLCIILDKLKAMGGDKNVIDDADFNAAGRNGSCVENFRNDDLIKEEIIISKWHKDYDIETGEGSYFYHTKGGQHYSIFTPEE